MDKKQVMRLYHSAVDHLARAELALQMAVDEGYERAPINLMAVSAARDQVLEDIPR